MKSWKNFGIKFLLIYLVLTVMVGCTARKTENKTEEHKENSLSELNSVGFDYLSIMEKNASLDRGYIFIREYKDGHVWKETAEQKNKSEVSEKAQVRYIYKTFNIYQKIRITERVTIKNTQKEAVSNWVWVISGIVFLIIWYFPKR